MWANDFLQLFYPRLCVLCKKLLTEDEQQICLHCFCDLPHTHYHKRSDNPLFKLFAGIPQLHEAAAFLLFEKEGKVQTLIHSFKYHGNKQLAKQLGRIASLEMEADRLFSPIDAVIPVPLHPKKERKRGYNQSEWIAKGIHSVYQIPIYKNMLYREMHTQTQTRKNIYERHLNVEKIFVVKDADSLAGKHILLVDDVITTGATIHACIEALSSIPDVRFSIFALSMANIY